MQKRIYKNRELTKTEENRIVRLYNEGWRIKNIAETISVSRVTVVEVARRNGLEGRGGSRYSREQKEKAMEMLKSMRVSEVSAKTKIPKSTITGWKRKLNGKKRKAVDTGETELEARTKMIFGLWKPTAEIKALT